MVALCNVFEIYAMVNVILNIDLANGYVYDYVYMVVLFHWWNTFFPFNLIGFGVDDYTFGEGCHQCSCSGHHFLLSCVGFPPLFCKFLNSCFTWSKKKSHHMLTLMILNSMKNHVN
jgi:hypothetical protein